MWLVAVMAAALLVLPWVIALALAPRHHLDATAVTILAAMSIPLSGLWIAWVTLAKGGGSGTSVSSLSMAQVADQLAVAVGAQWNAEAAIRRLNDPYPLPVSWAAADSSLTDSWGSLVKLATTGAGWPPPPPAGTWAAGPDDLAGEGGELAEVLARVPTGRLVVLGEPGAGKTMLMVRLVLDLLARRAEGGPVPILAPVASWNPAEQDLRDWLGARLLIDYPALAGPPPTDRTESTRAAALLAAGLILPVLDGLDEIPEQARGPAISRINDALRPGGQMVVTCRTQQYRDAVRPAGGVEVTLRAATAVQLRPLDADVVRSYLCDDAAGPVTRARWAPVMVVLATDAPAGLALRTPLMVSLARAIYNPRPGELAGAPPDPAELCSPALADRAAVQSLLLGAFVPAAYRHDPAGRWKAQDAERWLVFLACQLDGNYPRADLAWWRLRQAVPRTTFRLLTGLARVLLVGLAAGLFGGLRTGHRYGTLAGLVIGFVFGFGGGGLGLFFGLEGGLGCGLAVGFAAGLGLAAGFAVGLGFGLGVGLGFGLAGGYWAVLGDGADLAAEPEDLAEAASPRAVLARDRQAALRITFGYGLLAGLGYGLPAGLGYGLKAGLGYGLAAGLGFGLAAGLGFGLYRSGTQTAWPSYVFTRGWLAFHHRLPWRLMAFLDDAHRRGVLRQAGAVYQFRHIQLQHRLANRDVSRALA